MYIINEWLRYQNDPSEEREPAWEYELLCRVHVIGEINLGWASFRFWEIPPSNNERAVRSAVVRMRFRSVDTEEALQVPSKKDQHYHPKGPAGEFESLVSLFTRAHFVLVKGTSTGPSPLLRRYSVRNDVALTDMDGTSIRLSDVQNYFEMLRTIREAELNLYGGHQLTQRYVKTLVMAARFYHLALSLIAHDDTLAYVCLVSAIECMLSHYRASEFGLRDINAEVADLLEQAIPDIDTRNMVEAAFIRHAPKIRFRFVDFIRENVGDQFWQDTTRPKKPYCFRDLEDIEEYVRRVYDARSRAVHDGEPFPSSVGMEEERPLGLGMKIGGTREWKEKELVPSVRAFERLVHHVLMESLRKRSELALTALNRTRGSEGT